MKLADLAARIAQESGITNSQAEKAINAMKEVIAEELKKNEKFYLYGLGTFQVQTRKARRGRNPRTRQIIEIPAKRVIKWSSSKAFDEMAGLGKRESKGKVITPAKKEGREIDMTKDFLAHGAGTTLEEPPVAGKPTAVTPSAAALDEERLLKRARTMAKVNVEDIFLYYGDAIRDALSQGQDPREVVAEQLEQARKTLAKRVGEGIAGREDFIEKAFKAKVAAM